MMLLVLEHGAAREGAELFRVDGVKRHADDPAFRNEAGGDQVKEAGQKLLVGKIAGRAEQDDDLRHLGADPDRYSHHSVLPPSPLEPNAQPPHCDARLTETRQTKSSAERANSPPQSEACPSLEIDPFDEVKPLRPPGR